MSAYPGANSELPSSCDVAIIGAGPIGLMLGNLLGSAGVDVAVIERNDGLVGLPRAIAYDVETLRLFAQVGLFDAIAPELYSGSAGRLFQRSRRQADGDRSAAHSVRPFPARDVLPTALRAGVARRRKAICIRARVVRAHCDLTCAVSRRCRRSDRYAARPAAFAGQLRRRLRRRRQHHARTPSARG